MSNFRLISKINADFSDLRNVITSSEKRTGTDNLGATVNSIEPLLGMLANVAIGASFAISFFGMTYGIVMLVMSKGEKQEVNKARDAFVWSAAAIVLSFLAIAIKNIFFESVGVSTNAYL